MQTRHDKNSLNVKSILKCIERTNDYTTVRGNDMNTKLLRKIEQRLENLEQEADYLKNQIVNSESLQNEESKFNKKELQDQLELTLNKIKHINAANKSY
jgi:valyl-tRNA synthetase